MDRPVSRQGEANAGVVVLPDDAVPLCAGQYGIRASQLVIVKFHYTDTNTDTDPNGPARTQRSFAAKKARVRVHLVEFSYKQASNREVNMASRLMGLSCRVDRQLVQDCTKSDL